MHVAELIDGRVPGVEVRKLGAGEYSLRVRGTPSRVANGEPLVVVDGMPIGSGFSRRSALSDVSPGDVERIDVLKGADASVYGVRGANGVILITLKRPGR
jgi:TonB-dependent SusC/RagA subfamily outer membrane receptor